MSVDVISGSNKAVSIGVRGDFLGLEFTGSIQRHHAESISAYRGKNREPGKDDSKSLTSAPELKNNVRRNSPVHIWPTNGNK